MATYGPRSGLTKDHVSNLLRRFIKDGGQPVDVVEALRGAMVEEAQRLGLPDGQWREAGAWLIEVVAYLKGLKRE